MSYLDDSMKQLEVFEERVCWCYLDTVGKVTVGVGLMLPTPENAVLLPFETLGRRATEVETRAEYNRVLAMVPGKLPNYYKGSLTLPDYAINAQLLRVVMACDYGLRARLPNYDALPDPWKLGLIDLAYNLGIGGLFSKFPHFIQAIKDQNGQAAEAQCVRPQVGIKRNDWTKECFQS